MTLRKRKSFHLEFEILKNVEKMLTNPSEEKKVLVAHQAPLSIGFPRQE